MSKNHNPKMSKNCNPNFRRFTKEELREKIFMFSPEAAVQFSRTNHSDKWLLALNLRDMDCEENENEGE